MKECISVKDNILFMTVGGFATSISPIEIEGGDAYFAHHLQWWGKN